MGDKPVRKSAVRRAAGVVLLLGLALWALAALPLGAYLLAEGQTLGGRVVGGLLAGLVVLPVTLWLGRRHPNKVWRAINGVLAVCVLTLLILAGGLALPRELQAPRNAKQPASYQPGIYGGRPYWRMVGGSKGKLVALLSNLLPEPEHVALAGRLLPRLDSACEPQRTAQVAQAALALYREMDADEPFAALSSSLALSYRDAAGLGVGPGHYFLYVPRKRKPEPMPMLVFLHDRGGNLKTYLWSLSRLAEEEGCLVVAPTWGAGDWRRGGAAPAIAAAVDDAAALVDVDRERIYLVGLGCGSAGAAAALAAEPARYRGLALLGACRDDVSDLPALSGGKPALVLAGQADARMTPPRLAEFTAFLRAKGLETRETLLPSQDRHMMFTAPNETLSLLGEWVRSTDDPGQG